MEKFAEQDWGCQWRRGKLWNPGALSLCGTSSLILMLALRLTTLGSSLSKIVKVFQNLKQHEQFFFGFYVGIWKRDVSVEKTRPFTIICFTPSLECVIKFWSQSSITRVYEADSSIWLYSHNFSKHCKSRFALSCVEFLARPCHYREHGYGSVY